MPEVAASSLTFSRLPLAEALRAAARLGFRSVELAAHEGWAHLSPGRLAERRDAVGEEVAQALAAAGLRLVAINAGFGHADATRHLALVDGLCGLTAALGGTVVTIPAAAPPTAGAFAAAAAEIRRLESLVAVARRHGVALAVECHMGALTEVPATAAALCRAVPGLRLTLDPSHYWAGPAQGLGWEAVLPHVVHVHLRDAGTGGWEQIQMSVGHGRVDFPAVIGALGAAGYRGTYAEEYIDSIPIAGGGEAAEQAVAMARAAEEWVRQTSRVR